MRDHRELERELRDLKTRVAFPETPDLTTAVNRRVEAIEAAGPERPSRALRWQRVAIAAAAIVIVCGAVLAVSPQARSAAADLFDVVGIDLRFGDSGGDPPPLGENLRLGPRLDLADAQRKVAFTIRVPRGLGDPVAVHLRGEVVSLVYDDVLVTEFAAGFGEDLVVKELPSTSDTEAVTVAPGLTGYWISGAPHRLFLSDDTTGEVRTETLRLATNTLVWADDGVTSRVEGDVPLREALGIARSMR